MTYGPIDFVALEFKGNQFKGEIFPILILLVNQGIVRVIDMIVVQKDAKGTVSHREVQEHDKNVLALFDPTKSEINGMIQVEDIEMIGEKLEPNTTAAVILFENLWAMKFVEAVENANGRAVMHVRIPHELVVETMEKIASEEAALAAGTSSEIKAGSGFLKKKEVNMMRRRMVGRSVARVAVGTAVVAGTSGAVHHHQDQKYAKKDAAAQQQYDQAYQQGAVDAQAQQQMAPPPPQYAAPAPQAPAQSDLTTKLNELAQLHSTGVLTDEEFSAAKAKLLAG